MPEITEDLIRIAAGELILSHATDVEFLSIGEMMQDDPRFEGLTDAEFDDASERIDGAIGKAAVSVSWPDRLPGVDPDEHALLDILENGVGDGPVYVAVLSSVDGGPDLADITTTADCPAFVAQLLAWHRAGVQAVETERDKLGGQLAQLRHIIDEQAHRIQGGLDRIAELERERAALVDELAEADPEYTVGDGITPWTPSTYTNAEAARGCAKLNNWADAVVMRRIVGEWAELVDENPDGGA